RQQKKFTTALQIFFQQQQKEVMKNLKEEGLPKSRGGKIGEKSLHNWINKILFEKAKQDKLIVEMSGDMYRDNIQAGAEAVARLLGIDASDVLATPFVIDFIKDRSFLMLSVNKTTEDALRATLAEGVGLGEDLGQIRDRISSIYDEAQDFRAETIARTEVGAAQNFGRTAEMTNQRVEKKVWIATFSNTRPAHAAADGQIVRVDEAFSVDGEDLEYPGDPNGSPDNTINCQCSTSPTLG
ncbi:MAG TPA: phage minor head protein, partial [Candidatus Colwellbacteria bacterium]|nr:phage minor head protein [Candidatus Colwellbacteria bacterium]